MATSLMGYIPPDRPKPRDGQTSGRIEFVMTRKGWHHCWNACTNPKKCKWLSDTPIKPMRKPSSPIERYRMVTRSHARGAN